MSRYRLGLHLAAFAFLWATWAIGTQDDRTTDWASALLFVMGVAYGYWIATRAERAS